MNIYSIINEIEAYAPRSYQEKWDNSGLQIALPVGQTECTGVLLCLDVSERVIEEAVERGCNLVVSHHPLIFKGFKSLTGATRQERAAMTAIRKGVAVYSAHTSLDSTRGGVSYEMASLLGAEVTGVIAPLSGVYSRLTVFCPRKASSDVRLLLLDADTGTDEVTFSDCEGESLLPSRGINLNLQHEPLCAVSAVVPATAVRHLMSAVNEIPSVVGKATFKVEEVPASEEIGLGVFAVLPDSGMKASAFVDILRKAFGDGAIKVSSNFDAEMYIRKIALCGGAGGEFIGATRGCDAYVTGDIRYHDFFDAAENHCVLFDIGHFESEKCAKSIFYRLITKKFPKFAVYYSETDTNPVKYL